MNRLGYLAAICMVATACSADIHEGSNVVVTDSAGVTIVTSGSLEGLPTRVLAGPLIDLATSPDSAEASFSRASAVLRLEDGRLIIADGASRRLKVFGLNGSYLRMIIGPDGNPADFSAITAIWPAGRNRISVFNQREQLVTTLSLDGGQLQTVELSSPRLRLRPVGRLDTGAVLVRNLVLNVPKTGFDQAHVAVTRFGEDGVVLDTVGIWPTARMGRLGEPPVQLVSGPMFEPRLVTAAAGSRLLLSDCRTGEYSIIDPDNGLVQLVRWPTGDLGITDDDIRLYRDRRLAGLAEDQQGRTRLILDDMPINPTFPACDLLKIDAEGRAWIRSYVRPEAVQQKWLVFDPAGWPLFSIELPVATRIMDLGTDHLTVIETDTLNAERVRVYGIE